MSDLEAQLIPGTELDGRSPEFSPDSQSVAYYDVGLTQIRRSAISGGAPVVIASVPTNLYGLSWEEDGTILYGQPEGVYRVPATGGTPELIIPTEEDTIIYGARLLPDGIRSFSAWGRSKTGTRPKSSRSHSLPVNGPCSSGAVTMRVT